MELPGVIRYLFSQDALLQMFDRVLIRPHTPEICITFIFRICESTLYAHRKIN